MQGLRCCHVNSTNLKGRTLNHALVDNGSLKLKAHDNGNLPVWADRDHDKRLEKVPVVKDFFDDNEDELTVYGLDVDDLAWHARQAQRPRRCA